MLFLLSADNISSSVGIYLTRFVILGHKPSLKNKKEELSLFIFCFTVFAFLSFFRRLDSNQLICNCGLLSLIQMLSHASRHRNTQAAATCHFPENLRGRNLVDLTPEELNCRKYHFHTKLSSSLLL